MEIVININHTQQCGFENFFFISIQHYNICQRKTNQLQINHINLHASNALLISYYCQSFVLMLLESKHATYFPENKILYTLKISIILGDKMSGFIKYLTGIPLIAEAMGCNRNYS